MVAQAHHPTGNKHPAEPATKTEHPVAKAAVEKAVEKKGADAPAYPAHWIAGVDAPIVSPLITAGTYTTQQYVGIQWPLSNVLLTTTGAYVVNTDPTYTAWLAVPNTLGPIQSVARPPGS